MVLPSGTTLPPPEYAAVVVAAVAAVVWALYRVAPTVTSRTVVALSTWMAAGSAFYVTYQLQVVPLAVAPFLGSPTVYATTFALLGVVWLLADRADRATPRVLATAGAVVALVPTALAVRYGLQNGSFVPLPSLAALVVSAGVAAGAWWGLGRARPAVVAATSGPGALVVFGHALDGVSTAVGIDVLGYGERTPLSRIVIEFAGSLPTAPLVGSGWLFVVVKVALATLIVAMMAEYAREDPTEGSLVLGLVAAVGLGPGVHNLLLFAVTAT